MLGYGCLKLINKDVKNNKKRMGNCCCVTATTFSNKVALKFPHGKSGIEFSDLQKCFIDCTDINVWLKNIYKSQTFTNWVVYNDQMKKVDKKNAHGNGNSHAKGLVAWNDVKISWLCHSVPEFPAFFDGENGEISDIDQSELVYGQSFQYVEIPYHNDKLCDIMNQLYIMEVRIVEEKNHLTFPKRKNNAINTLILSDTVTHIAKSPKHQIDIYSQSIVIHYPHLWKVETWVRGHIIESEIPISMRRVRDIKKINYKDISYKESQDHSKWAVSDSTFYFVGDLNRMTSQYNRGGGGFICDNKDIAHSFRELICKDEILI
jgi:hypothetical protein